MLFDVFDHPRPAIESGEAAQVANDLYGIDGIASPLSGERDRSYCLVVNGLPSYVIKFGNAADSPDSLTAQAEAVRHVIANDPSLPVAEAIMTTGGETTGFYENHVVAVTRYLEGVAPIVRDSPPELRRALGRMAARLSRSLRGFDHQGLHRVFPWNLTSLEDLEPLLVTVDPETRPTLQASLARFLDETAPQLSRFPRQAVHGDLHDDNVVTAPSDPYEICGVFDFGDMTWGPRICELAITATYQSFETDPGVAISQVAAAYHVVDPLDLAEMDILPGLVMGRCVQSLLMAARHQATHPENSQYATSDVGSMLDTLRRLEDHDPMDLSARVRAACGERLKPVRSMQKSLQRRETAIGPALSLSYVDPVRVVRGEGVWLYDADGQRLLDAYNNVPHVGHAHPQVAAAVSAQTRYLATNTRYLVDSVTDYAQRLAELFPDPLSVVMFTNSGSEANDLAYQIAQAVTGHRGLITTEHAYHGTTWATAAMSPEEFPGFDNITSRVGVGETLRQSRVGPSLDLELERASSRLKSKGQDPAMAIFDTVFSSEGIFTIPDGLLTAARLWADQHSALLVADEVQAGFGRVGPSFWGFMQSEAVPDIVTLGKPMGNGYPMGAVVTTAAIADEFAQRWHFFSTFAGSPVAATAGMAVLDVVEDEHLAVRGQVVGDYLRESIAAIGHPSITEVRGPGLFIGVELTGDDEAHRVKEGMRKRGVLIGVTGPKNNVLKIRPPMVFAEHHADMLVEELAASLSATA